MATPVNKRQFGADAVNAPLSFNQLDSNFAYFENMIQGTPGYIPVLLGTSNTKDVTGFLLDYRGGYAQSASVIRQEGGYGIFAAGVPVVVAEASLQVYSSSFFTGSLATSGGLFATTVSASAITASAVLLQRLDAPIIVGNLTGSMTGSLTGSMSGSFVGSASGYFAGQVDGTSSFTTAPIQTILNNGNIATGSFTLVGGTMRIGTATTVTNLVVDGTSSFNGYITTENAKIGNNTTDVHYVSGGLTIHAPYVNGTYPAGVNINTGTNLSVGGKTAIRGDLAVSASMALVGSASFGNTLSVNGNTILSSSLWVASNQIVTGTLQVTGAVGFASTLDVKSDTTVTGSITNTSNTILGGTLTAANNIITSASLYVNTNAFITGTLQVTGAVGFLSTVDIKNNVSLTGSLSTTDRVALGSTLSVQSSTTLSGSLTVGGATQLNSTVGTTGIITSTNTTDSTATTDGSIITAGGVGIAKALRVGGLANIAGALTVGGATQLNSTLGATGVVTLTNATEATSTSTGAVILSGGLGMAKNLWVGGTLNVAGAVTLGTITGTLVNSLTVDNSSLQLDAGTTFNNSAARTISVKALGITNAMLAGSIANAKLANSTISGVALGGTLLTLTRGSYLTGGDYDGSTARTWAVDADTAATASKIAARDSSGNLNAAGFFQTSKRSAKTGIVDFDKNALDIIKSIKIVEFFYLTDLGNKRVGFIADDTDPILSTKNQDQMDTNSTLAVALKAIQQLEARVAELEKQLESK